ncbi:unnamed protein product, partial [Pleuronectes platessa]
MSQIPTPREHPYSSHISRFAMFPSFQSPDDPVTGVRAASQPYPSLLIPNSAPDVTLQSKTFGGPYRHEILETPVKTKQKAVRWKGEHSFWDKSNPSKGENQVFYPTPPKTVLPNPKLRDWDLSLSERTSNMLKNLERTHWITSYQMDYNARQQGAATAVINQLRPQEITAQHNEAPDLNPKGHSWSFGAQRDEPSQGASRRQQTVSKSSDEDGERGHCKVLFDENITQVSISQNNQEAKRSQQNFQVAGIDSLTESLSRASSELEKPAEGRELAHGISNPDILPRPRILPGIRPGHSAGTTGGENAALCLLDLQNSFSKTAAHRRFNNSITRAAVDLRDNVVTGPGGHISDPAKEECFCNSSSSSKHDSRQDSWEIVEGLRGGFGTVLEPQKQEGYMLKRRKWPMKGWHKRYFFLDKGILKYGKCSADIEKGKLHGRIDVGLSVMAIKKKAKCIDLDAEENIYHLKIKSQELFDEWVSKLRHHRLYRQNEIAMYPNEKSFYYPHYSSPKSPNSPSLAKSASMRKCMSLQRQSTVHSVGGFPVSCTSQAKVTAWLQSSDDMDKCSKDLSVCDTYLLELNHLLQSMEVLHRTYSAPSIQALQTSTFDSPKKEKRLPKKWRNKNYNKDVKTTLQVPSCISSGSIRLHASNPNLSTAALANDKADTESLDSPFDVAKLQEDFCRIATDLHATMKSALGTLTSERERLRTCLDHETCPPTSPQVVGLKNTLATAIAQNSELRERLSKIHAESHIVEPTLINLTAPVQ